MNANNILETIKMIEEEKLDIRTITMGISLLDCIDSNGDKAREKIYNKIITVAKDLVKVGNEIENEFKDANYGTFKKCVCDVVIEELSKIREKYFEYLNSDIIDEILEEGRQKSRMYAKAKYEAVKNKIGFY